MSKSNVTLIETIANAMSAASNSGLTPDECSDMAKAVAAALPCEIRVNKDDMRETFKKMEAWIERYETWYSQCAQLIDGFKPDAVAEGYWSEWDEGVRNEHTALYRALSELAPYIKMPLLERESVAGWQPSHDDWCRLSRLFNQSSNLRIEQDFRINEWLKSNLDATYRHRKSTKIEVGITKDE